MEEIVWKDFFFFFTHLNISQDTLLFITLIGIWNAIVTVLDRTTDLYRHKFCSL